MKSIQFTCGKALFFEGSRCLACGLEAGYEQVLGVISLIDKKFCLCANGQRHAAEDASFHALLRRWISLATMLNEISRSFGAPFLYPYVISPAVADKLRLAHHFASVWR